MTRFRSNLRLCYHAALERPARERDAFLETECRGDDGLRLEVQALLNRAASAETFLILPAADIAGQMASQPAAPVLTGLQFGAYEVQAPMRKWVVVIEMDARSGLPCRLVPFDGSSAGTPVGPAPAQCTDAAWSPDGKWMYFSANTGSDAHTWRQRFPDGTPEQITFGVTAEEGIHVAPDGRSLVTSIGSSQGTVCDARGERQVTSEGFAFLPSRHHRVSGSRRRSDQDLRELVQPQGVEPIPAPMSWTPDGRFVYLKFADATYALPLQPGEMLPPAPVSGFSSRAAVAAVPGARLVSE